MKYAFFDKQGFLISVHNDQTVSKVPTGAVELTEDQWLHRTELKMESGKIVFSQYSPTSEQLAYKARQDRNKKLEETDWTILPDSPFSEEKIILIKEYRKSLRDLPMQSNFPFEIIWPVSPL